MTVAAEVVFWVSVFLILYTYGIYRYVLEALALVYRVKLECDPGYRPSVSVIVAARNEEANIAGRIRNLLELDYPPGLLEIIIGSDGSTDGTVRIASGFGDGRIKVLDFPVNRGRAMTHNDCVGAASGEVLVFTDAETAFDSGFLKSVAGWYADERVGAVCGSLHYISRDNPFAGAEGFYFRYERRLRGLESGLGILASGTGACFSIRKSLFRRLEGIEDVDFTLPIECVKRGLLVRFEPGAKAYDYPPGNPEGILRARIRMTSKYQSSIRKQCGLGFMFRHPAVSWAIVSRKLVRQLAGVFMATALVSNILLIDGLNFYTFTLCAQAAFYGLFLAAWLNVAAGRGRKNRLLSWVFVFVLAHAGMVAGAVKGLLGRAPVSYQRKQAGA